MRDACSNAGRATSWKATNSFPPFSHICCLDVPTGMLRLPYSVSNTAIVKKCESFLAVAGTECPNFNFSCAFFQ